MINDPNDQSGIGFDDLENVPAPPRFVIRRLNETLSRPDKCWAIPNFGGAGDLVMIVGEPGTAKTTLAIDLMFRAALGMPVFNQFQIEGPASALLCHAEGGPGIPGRYRASLALLGSNSTDPRLANVFETDYVPNLSKDDTDPDSAASFIQAYKSMGLPFPTIVFIDTLIDAGAGADENKANDAQLICANAKKIADAFQCIVVLIHHTGKNGDIFGRGSSVFRGKMDCIIHVTREPSSKLPKGAIRCIKLKDGEPWGPFGFEARVREGSIGLEWKGEVPFIKPKQYAQRDLLLEVLRANAVGIDNALSQKELTERTGIPLSSLTSLITSLVKAENWNIAITSKKVLEDDGKQNRAAKHYYLPECESTGQSAEAETDLLEFD